MAKRCPFVVPNEYMVPLGAKITRELERCADSWTDSEIRLYRAELPPQYHAVPEDALWSRWMNIRKKKTPGYKLNGTGPAVGSRKPHRHAVPKWYADYVANDPGYRERRRKCLEFWETCCVCDGGYRLDVHHRTYERLGNERFTDIVVLCRHCHDIFHGVMLTPPERNPGVPQQGVLFEEAGELIGA